MEKFSDALAEKATDREAQVDAELKKVNELKEYFVPKLVQMAWVGSGVEIAAVMREVSTKIFSWHNCRQTFSLHGKLIAIFGKFSSGS